MISSMGGYRCCHIQFWNMVIMEKEKRYVASISGGKDSMAMVLGLMEKGWPLTHCVYFDTGMEFSCMGAKLLFYSRKGISWKKCSFDGSSAGTDHRTMEAIGAVGHAAG